jgi:hypothetical protein
MKLEIIDLHCLNATCDDYENIQSILDDVRKAVHFPVEKEAVTQSVRKLHDQKLIDAFYYDAPKTSFVITNPGESQFEETWFSISEAGRRVLDEIWVD